MPSTLPSGKRFAAVSVAPQLSASLDCAPFSLNQSNAGVTPRLQPSLAANDSGTEKPARCRIRQGATPPNAFGLSNE